MQTKNFRRHTPGRAREHGYGVYKCEETAGDTNEQWRVRTGRIGGVYEQTKGVMKRRKGVQMQIV